MIALTALALSGAALLAVIPGAGAYSDKVESACRDDYWRLCPGYPVGSASLRLCMESKSKQMSQSCIKALVDAGEVDRRRVKRGF
jgi:hypothetical protein